MEQSLKWFSDSTVSILDTEHDLKTNDTARFRKRSANKYKGLNIVFIIILPLNIPSMDQNNLNNSAINLNTKIHYYRHLQKYEIFLCPKKSLHIIKQDYILGNGDFFRILNCEREAFNPPT